MDIDLSPQNIMLGLGWYFVFVFSTCLHEAAHAWASLHLGDPTAHQGGQVTLNPVPHIQREPIGMILVPLATFFYLSKGWMMGWASAPYNVGWAMNYPKRSALMALAGPSANLLLVLTSGVWLRTGIFFGWFQTPEYFPYVGHVIFPPFESVVQAAQGGAMTGLATILSIFFMLNLILFVFNLLPVPPLDGSSVLMLFMDNSMARRYMAFMHQSGFWMIGMIVAWHFFPKIFVPVGMFFMRILFAGL